LSPPKCRKRNGRLCEESTTRPGVNHLLRLAFSLSTLYDLAVSYGPSCDLFYWVSQNGTLSSQPCGCEWRGEHCFLIGTDTGASWNAGEAMTCWEQDEGWSLPTAVIRARLVWIRAAGKGVARAIDAWSLHVNCMALGTKQGRAWISGGLICRVLRLRMDQVPKRKVQLNRDGKPGAGVLQDINT